MHEIVCIISSKSAPVRESYSFSTSQEITYNLDFYAEPPPLWDLFRETWPSGGLAIYIENVNMYDWLAEPDHIVSHFQGGSLWFWRADPS